MAKKKLRRGDEGGCDSSIMKSSTCKSTRKKLEVAVDGEEVLKSHGIKEILGVR